MQETWVQSLGGEDPPEKGMVIHSSILAWRIPMDRGVWRATQSWTRLSDWRFHFHQSVGGCCLSEWGYTVVIDSVFIYLLLMVHFGLMSNFLLIFLLRMGIMTMFSGIFFQVGFFHWVCFFFSFFCGFVFFFFWLIFRSFWVLLCALGPENPAGTEASEALWGSRHHYCSILAWHPGRPEIPQDERWSGVTCGTRDPLIRVSLAEAPEHAFASRSFQRFGVGWWLTLLFTLRWWRCLSSSFSTGNQQ